MFRDVRPLFEPRSITLVGASQRAEAWPTRILRNLARAGYAGPVYQVNPKYDRLWDQPCYPSVRAVPGPVDQVVIVVPAAQVPAVLEEAGQRGARSAIIMSGGFLEAGTAEGRALHAATLAVAERYGLRVCGPNCQGNILPRQRAYTYCEQRAVDFQPGPLGLICQSSGVLSAIARAALLRGIGLTYGISAGNELNTDAADYLNFLVDDPETRVIGLFLEGIRRPAAFREACARAARAGKPLLVIKVGVTEAGRQATQTHTGALAGSNEAFDAFCASYGLVRVRSPNELVDVAALLLRMPLPAADGVALLALSGGMRGLLADLLAEAGLRPAQLAPETLAGLSALLGVGTAAGNPLDAGWSGLSNLETYLRCVRLLLDDPDVAVLGVQEELPYGPEQAARAENALRVEALAREVGKPLFFYSRGDYAVNETSAAFLARARAPFLQGAWEALQALGHVMRYRRWRADHPDGPVGAGAPSGQAAPRRALLDAAEGRPLPDERAFALLESAGLPTAPWRLVDSEAEAVAAAAAVGYPVALKRSVPGLTHKTEAGGVRLGLADPQAVAQAYRELIQPGARVLVQAMAPPESVEVLLSCYRDPQFGPVLVCGLGGLWVEVYRDVSLRLAPVSRTEALAMVRELRGSPLFEGRRGRPPVDIAALVDALVALGQLGVELGEALGTVEINPFMVGPVGRGGMAVDALVLPAGPGDGAGLH